MLHRGLDLHLADLVRPILEYGTESHGEPGEVRLDVLALAMLVGFVVELDPEHRVGADERGALAEGLERRVVLPVGSWTSMTPITSVGRPASCA